MVAINESKESINPTNSEKKSLNLEKIVPIRKEGIYQPNPQMSNTKTTISPLKRKLLEDRNGWARRWVEIFEDFDTWWIASKATRINWIERIITIIINFENMRIFLKYSVLLIVFFIKIGKAQTRE